MFIWSPNILSKDGGLGLWKVLGACSVETGGVNPFMLCVSAASGLMEKFWRRHALVDAIVGLSFGLGVADLGFDELMVFWLQGLQIGPLAQLIHILQLLHFSLLLALHDRLSILRGDLRISEQLHRDPSVPMLKISLEEVALGSLVGHALSHSCRGEALSLSEAILLVLLEPSWPAKRHLICW